MILIISSSQDAHAIKVMEHLDREGAPYHLLDLSLFPQQYALTINYDAIGEARQFRFDRQPLDAIDLSQVRSVWWRRPQPFALHPEITRSSHRNFALNECHEAISGLWHALDCRWINDPAKDDIAHRKVYQLKQAKEVGLRIPASCITTSSEAAMTFFDQMKPQKVICKAFSATKEEWRETRLVTEQEIAHILNVKYAPVIFQEYIEAIYDLRITVVGEKIFAGAIYSQETDYKVDVRMDIGNAKIAAVELPEHVQDQLRTLMKKLGLHYGAIDMRLMPDGQYVFLEVNPAGQWLFIEEKTGQAISQAMAMDLIGKEISIASR